MTTNPAHGEVVGDIGALGHLNLIEYSRASARWARGGLLREHEGVVLCAGSRIPVNLNSAWRVHDGVDPDAVVHQADELFGTLGCGYTVKVRPGDDDLRSACERADIAPFGHPDPEMACARPVTAPVPEGVLLRPVSSVTDVGEFARVGGAAYATYGMPGGEAEIAFFDAEGFLRSPHVNAVLARRGDEALSGALVLLSHGIAGVYWVGTVDNARRRGLGAAVTAAVTNWAFDQGARAVTLQASVMGRPVYERLGYETLYDYQNYVRWQVPK